MFPQFEGPLLLIHCYGLCISLTQTIGTRCGLWVRVSVGILFFGPILFIAFAVNKFPKAVRRGNLVFDEAVSMTWIEMRDHMKERAGPLHRAKMPRDYFQSRRYRGNWITGDSAEMKSWKWLIQDFSKKSWKVFLWVVLHKLLLAGMMELSLVSANALLNLLLQLIFILILLSSWPQLDDMANIVDACCGLTNLLAMLMAGLPSLLGAMPNWIPDTLVVSTALAATGITVIWTAGAATATICRALSRVACAQSTATSKLQRANWLL